MHIVLMLNKTSFVFIIGMNCQSLYRCLYLITFRSFFQGDHFTPYLFTAVYLYGLWLNFSLTNNIDPREGIQFRKFARNVSFDGMYNTGSFVLETVMFENITISREFDTAVVGMLD